MKMKDIISKFAAGAVAMLLAVSCSLDEVATSFVSPSDYYKTESQCQSSVNGCYINLKNIFQVDYFTAVECVTDLLFVNTNNDNARLKISPSNPGVGNTIWQYGYQGVMRCNATIAGIETSPITDDVKAPLLAEAKVVRAFYYWILTSFFGDVPFYTYDVADREIMEKVAVLGRTSATEIRSYFINELKECVPDLTQQRFCEDEENRMGAAAGWMVLAKMAQWNEDWDSAIAALNKIEDIYGDLSDYSLDDILFRNDNTPESIFEIQRTYTAGGLTVTTSVACICTPTHQGTEYIYDGVEVLELGNAATTWTSMRPTDYLCQGLQTKKGSDLRTKMNMAWDYNGISFKSASTRPWVGPKFWCPNMQQAYDYNNNHIFRYADAVLMLAECWCRAKSPDYAKSVEYLNEVRERAEESLYTYKTPELLLEEIQKERGRELLGEWQRKFDLVRWGIWYDMVLSNTGRAETAENIRPCHEYYPIPDTQVTYSKGALDNKEYEKYGL